MADRTFTSQPSKITDRDMRSRLGRVRVLVADRDHRTALLVQRVLFSFGFRHMDLATNGEAALQQLRSRSFDLIITEWNMEPVDGITLVKAIRTAKNDRRLRRDIPIIMLTAQSEKDSVQAARDAGITEFIAKPFSAKTISNRIIRVIDFPRSFIDTPAFAGPCRRRKGEPPPGMRDRRLPRDELSAKDRMMTPAIILPPNYDLREQIGIHASKVITEMVVNEAQIELMKSEGEYVEWAKGDIELLNKAFNRISANSHDADAHKSLREAAYAIKSQAGIFGYDLGTIIAGRLIEYLDAHPKFEDVKPLVIRKHIDAVTVIFNQKIKDSGQHIGVALLESLEKLVYKLG